MTSAVSAMLLRTANRAISAAACRRTYCCAPGGGVGLSSTQKQRRRQLAIDRILRVDHAGEIGAVRIYEGQLAVLGNTDVGPVIREMLEQEKHHVKTFAALLPEHKGRPTAMQPIWNVAGFVLGASTALLGREAAMACTVAVETAIGEHYDSQLRHLMNEDDDGIGGLRDNRALVDTIRQFRDEELEHLDTGLRHDAEQAPCYQLLSGVVKNGCKAAIWISERV